MTTKIHYSDFLLLLKDGDTFFLETPFNLFKPKTWLSNIIRTIGKTPNHSGIYFIDNGKHNLYGAKPEGVVVKNLYDEIKTNIINVKRKKNDNIKSKKSWCVSMIGKEYDYSSLLFFSLIFHLFKVWLGKTGKAAQDAFYCYEYTAGANKYPKTDAINALEYYNWKEFDTIISNVKIYL